MGESEEIRRRFPRIKSRIPLRYQVRGRAGFKNVSCDDLSEEGSGFINDEFIAPNTLLALEMNLLSRILSPVGKVRWAQPLPHSDRFRIGVEFVEFNPQDKHHLSNYISLQRGSI